MYTYMYVIYIYIYTHTHTCVYIHMQKLTPNLPTNIVDFRGLDSSTILNLRGGILMSIGNFP